MNWNWVLEFFLRIGIKIRTRTGISGGKEKKRKFKKIFGKKD
jgi:hypothetical protein